MDATQTLDSELLGDWALLNDHQKKAVLDLVKAFANAESDWWDEIEEKAASSINKGLQQARLGLGTSHEEVMKQYTKRSEITQ